MRRPVAGFSQRLPVFDPRSSHMGFVMNKVALGLVFFEYFGFTCQFSFHRLLHTDYLSSGAGTIGRLVADVPSGLSLTQNKKLQKKKTQRVCQMATLFSYFACKNLANDTEALVLRSRNTISR
jgi:hypothetical protein